jgi:predicted GIY-YIG superfamily endonuclease
MGFFVYSLSYNGKIRYVGFTENLQKRLEAHVHNARKGCKSHCYNWIRQVLAAGGYPEIEMIIESPTKEKAWFNERVFIDAYRADGHDLTNMTDGGGGGGHVVSAETRTKTSATLRKVFQDPVIRAKMGSGTRGKPRSAETRKKIGEAQIGKVITEEAKAKSSAAMRGRKLSSEHKAAVSRGLLGGKRTEAQRETMRLAQLLQHAKKREAKLVKKTR